MQKTAFMLLALLVSVGASSAEEITLNSGDTINVTVVEDRGDVLLVEHAELGQFEVPKSAVKPPDPPNPGLFGTGFLRGWKRNFNAGISGGQGNADSISANAALAINAETPGYRGAFTSRYFFSEQREQGTAVTRRGTNEFFMNYQHDFLFEESKWFIFTVGRYDYNQLQTWEHRVSANAGAGYEFVKSEKFDLIGNAGFGASRSWGSENRWRPEGVLGLAAIWHLTDSQRFEANATYYPDLEQFTNPHTYRLVAGAAYHVDIQQVDGLSLKIGFSDNLDSASCDAATFSPCDTNSLNYFANLGYDF